MENNSHSILSLGNSDKGTTKKRFQFIYMNTDINIFREYLKNACGLLAKEKIELDKYKIQDHANENAVAIKEEKIIHWKIFLDETEKMISIFESQIDQVQISSYRAGYNAGKSDAEEKYKLPNNTMNQETYRAWNVANTLNKYK